jgi:hypothetical protein
MVASGWARILLVSVATFACGGRARGESGTADERGAAEPVVGEWIYQGNLPGPVGVDLTFDSAKTFTFAETIAPATTPAGVNGNACVTTNTYLGTYALGVSGDMSALTWAFEGGQRNAISECGANDAAGTPLTDEDISVYRDEGLIPPESCTYAVTSTTLVLTSMVSGTLGIGHSPGTTFTKLP